jgi:kumamolisin
MKVLILAIVAASQAFGQEAPPQSQRPPSDKAKAGEQDDRAHTNYVLSQFGQAAQVPNLSQPMSEIVIRPEAQSRLQIERPSSDFSRHSNSEEIARLALLTGEHAPAGAEIRAHTNYEFLAKANRPPGLPLPTIKNGTPSELLARYGFQTQNSQGFIVLVGAYDYPTADADLTRFSAQFGLPSCTVKNGCLQIVKISPDKILKDTDPRVPDCGWSGEAALDLQWAHAIAPSAKLTLVEAVSSRKIDIFAAVDKAIEIAEKQGGGTVSMSWSFDEFKGETDYDSHFLQHETVLFFAASGDLGGRVVYPSASPFVVSVGGTSVVRDANGTIVVEQGWDSSGGGNSNFEPRPSFQNQVENISDAGRVTPDIAGPAGLDEAGINGSPVWAGTVCGPYTPGWYSVGGTSLATPIVAAAATVALPKGGSTTALLQNIYDARKTPTSIRDITVGQAGGNLAKPGYDKVTGVGVPSSINFAIATAHP